jgi:hypothetical protein
MTAIYFKNRSPTTAAKGATPEDKWSGSKVDLSQLWFLDVTPML